MVTLYQLKFLILLVLFFKGKQTLLMKGKILKGMDGYLLKNTLLCRRCLILVHLRFGAKSKRSKMI